MLCAHPYLRLPKRRLTRSKIWIPLIFSAFHLIPETILVVIKKIEVANQSIKHFSVNNLNRSIGPASCRKANYFGGDQLVLGAAINLEFGDLGRLDFHLVMGVHDGPSFAASSKIPSIETRRHGRAHGEGDREAAALLAHAYQGNMQFYHGPPGTCTF